MFSISFTSRNFHLKNKIHKQYKHDIVTSKTSITKSLNTIPGRCPQCTLRSTVVMLELPFESILRWVEEKDIVIQLSEHENSRSYSPHQQHTKMIPQFLMAMATETLTLIATAKESMGFLESGVTERASSNIYLNIPRIIGNNSHYNKKSHIP